MTKRKLVKNNYIKIIILGLIIILSVFTITYPLRNNRLPFNPIIHKTEVSGLIVYPGSRELVYTKNGNNTTINYKTSPGVVPQQLFNYYSENLTKMGWKILTSSDTEVVFEKSQDRLRIWILYATNSDDGLDYILDYFPARSQ